MLKPGWVKKEEEKGRWCGGGRNSRVTYSIHVNTVVKREC